jgi:radical SAM superfamily enzyme YgiQ (UPF0313 family)
VKNIHLGELRTGIVPSRKVLFLAPPHVPSRRKAKEAGTVGYLGLPYGVLVVASFVQRNCPEAQVRLIDLSTFPDADREAALEETLREFRPDIVGISLTFDMSYRHLGWILERVRECAGNPVIVIGGASATTWWDRILSDHPQVNAICYSDGELAMLDLVQTEDPFAEIGKAPWITRESMARGQKPEARKVIDLDTVIDVNYGLIDVSRYGMKETFSPFRKSRETGTRQFYIGTSRGCPFGCIFCSLPLLGGKTMRFASIDAVERHVRQLVDDYGMDVLTIYDDQLLANRSRAKALFRMLSRYKLRIETPSGLSVAFIDEEMAALMKAAGVDTAPLAIESGSERLLNKVIHKPLKREQVRPAVEYLRKQGMFVKGFFVTGIPGETEEDRQATLSLIREVELDWSSFSVAYPLRGTEMYNICVQNGYIRESDRIGEGEAGEYIINIPGVEPDYIRTTTYRMNLDVNFVHNRAMAVGDYAVAARCFEDVLHTVEEHAFAHYFLSKACEKMPGEGARVGPNMAKFKEIIGRDSFWMEHARYFGLA